MILTFAKKLWVLMCNTNLFQLSLPWWKGFQHKKIFHHLIRFTTIILMEDQRLVYNRWCVDIALLVTFSKDLLDNNETGDNGRYANFESSLQTSLICPYLLPNPNSNQESKIVPRTKTCQGRLFLINVTFSNYHSRHQKW